MTNTKTGFIVLSLLTMFAACGEAIPPPPGEPPPGEPPPGEPPPGEPPDASPPPPPEEVCGDGSLDPGEECDTGGASATCDIDCTAAVCGDSLVNPAAGEQCDDGNAVAGDGCSECRLDCGNGVLEPGEECDPGDADGNGRVDPTPGCDRDCTTPACGDGSFNPAAEETCDDGNNTSADGCSAGCTSEISITGIDSWEPLDMGRPYSAVWQFDGTGWWKTRLGGVDTALDHWSAGPLHHYIAGFYEGRDWTPVANGPTLWHHKMDVSHAMEVPAPEAIGRQLEQIWGAQDEVITLYVITRWHGLWRYDAAGWAEVELPAGGYYPGYVWGTGPDDVYLHAYPYDEGEGWFHFDGTSWTRLAEPTVLYHVMAGTGPNDIVVAGSNDVARFDGNQWTEWSAPQEDLNIQRVASGGSGSFAVIDRGRVGVFHEDTWQYFDFTGEVEFEDVAMLPNGHVFAVGDTKIFHYDGQDWDIQQTDPPEHADYTVYGPLVSIQFTPGSP